MMKSKPKWQKKINLNKKLKIYTNQFLNIHVLLLSSSSLQILSLIEESCAEKLVKSVNSKLKVTMMLIIANVGTKSMKMLKAFAFSMRIPLSTTAFTFLGDLIQMVQMKMQLIHQKVGRLKEIYQVNMWKRNKVILYGQLILMLL